MKNSCTQEEYTLMELLIDTSPWIGCWSLVHDRLPLPPPHPWQLLVAPLSLLLPFNKSSFSDNPRLPLPPSLPPSSVKFLWKFTGSHFSFWMETGTLAKESYPSIYDPARLVYNSSLYSSVYTLTMLVKCCDSIPRNTPWSPFPLISKPSTDTESVRHMWLKICD